jgi:hypothetical protein
MKDERKLGSLAELPVPPPSAALLAMVREGGAVKMRSPWRSVAAVVGVAFAAVAIHTLVTTVRKDLASLPPVWFWATLAAWLVAFALPLTVALVPRRRSVIPSSERAAVLGIVAPMALIAMSIWLRVDGKDTVIPAPEKVVRYVFNCMLDGLEMAAMPLVASMIALRASALPVQTRWLGAAIGAANGSLAGFMLHIHCPIGGDVHVAIGHAGAAVVGAIIGAIAAPIATRGR